jgi:hypothetical protein
MFQVKALKRITCRYGNKSPGDRFDADRDWSFHHQALGVIEILTGDDTSEHFETKQTTSGDSGSLSPLAKASEPSSSLTPSGSTSSRSATPIGSPPTLQPATPATVVGGTITSEPSASSSSAASSGHKTNPRRGDTASDTSPAVARQASRASKGGSAPAGKSETPARKP